MVVLSRKIEDTTEIAKNVLDYVVKHNDKHSAIIIGLYGDLGAGKTAFVKEIANVTGIKENISSPTFVILKRYGIEDLKFKNLIHIDAYRLESGEELEKLGLGEIIKNPENIIFIEWPNNVKDILPNNIIKIHFEFIDENTRKIEYDFS